MTEREHLSIGEVLSLLRDEFPDVTISKIRFLESQGLLDPERTPSGYRKFYEEDIERLRWILRQQREHFLPLKVIKGRLSEAGGDAEDELDEVPAAGPRGGTGTNGAPAPVGEVRTGPGEVAEQVPLAMSLDGGGDAGPPRVAVRPARRRAPRDAATAAPSPTAAGSSRPAAEPDDPGAAGAVALVPVARSGPGARGGAAVKAGHGRPSGPGGKVAARSAAAAPTAGAEAAAAGDDADGDVTAMTMEELASAAGVDLETARELQRFGLLQPRDMGGTDYFDGEALVVARLAAAFARHGVEARHLRMYKNAAERETGLFEQVVMPLFKQRNPQARLQAMETVAELSALSTELREVLLRAALRAAF